LGEKMGKNLTKEAESYLGKDETIISSYRKEFFATEKRILIPSHRHGFEDFSYKHITSIKYEKYARKSPIIFGVLLIIIGLILSSFNTSAFIALFVVGIILVILALKFKINFYLIRTTGGEDFKIHGGKKQDSTEEFIKSIREHTD
jgi:uncharacterized membrane protein